MVFFINICAFSQKKCYVDYYKICNVALEHKVKKEYFKSIELYDSIFNEYFPFPEEVLSLARCYYLVNDTQKYHETLKLLISSGYKIEENVPLFSERGLFYSKKISLDDIKTELILEEYDSLRYDFLKNNDIMVNSYMEAISIIELFANTSRGFAKSDIKLRIVQNVNFDTKSYFLINLLKSNIDLSRKHTDYWDNSYFVVALIHTAQYLSDEKQFKKLDEYLSKLEYHVKMGNLHPQQYAVILDNLYFRKTKKSLYGVQHSGKKKKNEFIEDISNVDNRRSALYLPPLWVSYSEKGYELPISYPFNEFLK
jgi:hypothetical protein